MNILLFTDTYPPEINGVATSTHTLATVMRKNGHNVLVCTTNPFNNKLLITDEIIRIPGTKIKGIYDYKMINPLNRKVEEEILKFRPDVMHIQTDIGLSIFGRYLIKKYSIPMVYTYHTMYEDYTHYVTKGRFDRFARAAVQWWARLSIDVCNEFVTPSLKTKDYMRSIGVDIFINVVPTGIDFSRFAPKNISSSKVESLRKKYGISKDDFVFLYLGRVAKEKNIETLIHGYAHFIKHNPSTKTKFVIVGNGPAISDLSSLADELNISNNVIFTGGVNPELVPQHYQLGNIFASASLSETQGLTYMEAMAAKLVVFAKFDNNLIDVIKDEETGFFFNDGPDFSKKVKKMLEMSDEEIICINNNAIKNIDNYSVSKFYDRMLEVYKKAIKKKW